MATVVLGEQDPKLQRSQSVTYASCRLESYNGSGVTGLVRFTQREGEQLLVQALVKNLTPGLHGFHVHEFGDLTDGCASTGGHFNPAGVSHGAHDAEERHAGDFRMMEAGEDGWAHYVYGDPLAMLSGPLSIVGRGLVLHGGVDDLGLGTDAASAKHGNSGPRVACCVIGLSSEPSF